MTTVAKIAVAAVRRYVLRSKEAEARNVVRSIAQVIVASWEAETYSAKPAPPAKKKLQSFPAIPSTVPRGTKYPSSPADWSAWAPIKFEMDQPQYYQYEVRAAKDGESADVIARGDLTATARRRPS